MTIFCYINFTIYNACIFRIDIDIRSITWLNENGFLLSLSVSAQSCLKLKCFVYYRNEKKGIQCESTSSHLMSMQDHFLCSSSHFRRHFHFQYLVAIRNRRPKQYSMCYVVISGGHVAIDIICEVKRSRKYHV